MKRDEKQSIKKKCWKILFLLILGIGFCFSVSIPSVAAKEEKKISNKPMIIALDPGHGGEEDGAYYYGIKEKDINLKVAKMVKEELETYPGIKVVLTRTEDEEVNLYERANRAKLEKADIFISLHFNASARIANGASVYISTGEGKRKSLQKLADSILGEFEALGLENSGTFARVTQMGGRRADGSFDDYYGVLRHSYNFGMPSILIEHCYMDSEIDQPFIQEKRGLEKLAKADADGIASYYGWVKADGSKNVPKHAKVFGGTTKAVKANYYDAPRVTGIQLVDYEGITPSMATYEVTIEDEVGMTSLFLIYKDGTGRTSTVSFKIGKPLKTGTHQLKAYIPAYLAMGNHQLIFIGGFNKVGYDMAYNYAGGSMIGFGKCDWLNTFSYSGTADLLVKKEGSLSTAHAKLMDYEIQIGLRNKKNRYFMSIYPN